MSDTNQAPLPPDTAGAPSATSSSVHPPSTAITSSNTAPKDASSNEDIVNKLFDDKLQLNDDDQPDAASDDDEADEYADAQPPSDNSTALTADDEAEASRRDYEQTLSAEQLAENQRKAVEIKDFGNLQFKNEEYTASLESYTEGLDICPLASVEPRAVLLGNRAAAHTQLGNSKAALDDCSKALELKPDYVKVLLRRAKLYEDTDKLDESLQDFKRVLELNGDSSEARQALVRLPPKIDERNEKLKTEMLGKLKDLGNMILRPFGLSTNNFQMKQDPSTGSYSVNFQQNQ